MHNPTRKNRGRAMRVTLFCEWGRHCSTLAASPKHSTARCLSPPTNTTFVECGRGGTGCVHRGVAQAQHCKSQPPPPLRRTKQTCNGGGGQRMFVVASFMQALKVAYPPPLTSLWRRTSTALNVLAYPHPNHTSCPGQKNYIRLTYFR